MILLFLFGKAKNLSKLVFFSRLSRRSVKFDSKASDKVDEKNQLGVRSPLVKSKIEGIKKE